MEQKKLLLVVVSVGVFLVIVIGAGMIVFSPRARSEPPIASSQAVPGPASAPASADPSEWVRNPQSVSGFQAPAPGSSTRGDVIIIYGERPATDSAAQPAAAPAVAADGSVLVDIAVPKPTTALEPPSASTGSIVGPSQPTAAISAKPAVVSAPAKKPADAPKPATAPAQTKPKAIDEFWVQTGSFAAKARADAAKQTLGAKGISSLVETKELEGKTFYRVRVGPYASKNEADYWLSLINTIDGFTGSYVSLVKAKR